MKKQTISVIIPTLNMGRFIEDGIASILRQAVRVDEIIVVDSDSIDETPEVLARLSQEDTRIRVAQAPRKGPATARNKGLESATGELIAFLDADCLWTRDKLALQLARLDREPRVDIVGGLVTHFNALDADRLGPSPQSRVDTIFDVGVFASVFCRSVFDRIGVFDDSLLYAEDWDLLLRVLEADIPISILTVPTAFSLRHPASMMAQKNSRRKSDMFRAFSMSMARRRREGKVTALPRFETFLEAPPEIVR